MDWHITFGILNAVRILIRSGKLEPRVVKLLWLYSRHSQSIIRQKVVELCQLGNYCYAAQNKLETAASQEVFNLLLQGKIGYTDERVSYIQFNDLQNILLWISHSEKNDKVKKVL